MCDIVISQLGGSAYCSSPRKREYVDAGAPGQDVAAAADLVRGFLRRRMRGPIEDVCQESMARALAAGARYSGDSTFSTYMLGIAVNVQREAERSAARRQRVHRSDVDALADESLPVDVAIAREAERARLLAAFAALPEEYRELLRQYYWDGASAAAIAQQVGVREGTVRSRIRRAKTLLRLALLPGRRARGRVAPKSVSAESCAA